LPGRKEDVSSLSSPRTAIARSPSFRRDQKSISCLRSLPVTLTNHLTVEKEQWSPSSTIREQPDSLLPTLLALINDLEKWGTAAARTYWHVSTYVQDFRGVIGAQTVVT